MSSPTSEERRNIIEAVIEKLDLGDEGDLTADYLREICQKEGMLEAVCFMLNVMQAIRNPRDSEGFRAYLTGLAKRDPDIQSILDSNVDLDALLRVICEQQSYVLGRMVDLHTGTSNMKWLGGLEITLAYGYRPDGEYGHLPISKLKILPLESDLADGFWSAGPPKDSNRSGDL